MEIKSAATFTPDFLKGIEHFRKAVGARSAGRFVLYNGQERYMLKGTRVFNPIVHAGNEDFLTERSARNEKKILLDLV